MRTGASKTQHDQLITHAVTELEAKGYTAISADHLPNYSQPAKITWKGGDGHIPDITAKGQSTLLIMEAETEDSIESTHTASQFKLFSVFAREHANEFWVIVPSRIARLAGEVLSRLGIENAKVWAV